MGNCRKKVKRRRYLGLSLSPRRLLLRFSPRKKKKKKNCLVQLMKHIFQPRTKLPGSLALSTDIWDLKILFLHRHTDHKSRPQLFYQLKNRIHQTPYFLQQIRRRRYRNLIVFVVSYSSYAWFGFCYLFDPSSLTLRWLQGKVSVFLLPFSRFDSDSWGFCCLSP